MAFMRTPSEGEMARWDPSEPSPGMGGRRSRLECSYEPFMKKFLWKDRSLLSQFDVLYDLRLRALSDAVRRRAQRQWPAEVFCERIVDARPNSTHILVGTLHKAMRLQPSVLDEYKEERGMSESIMLPAGKFSGMDDSVMLEDGSGRVRLCGAALDAQKLSTGIVVAVLGELQPSGEFLVTGWCPPGMPPPRKPPASISRPPGSLILLVSGLRCGKEGRNPLPLQLLTDFVGGYGAGEEASDIAARIARVLICGDCVGGAGFLGHPSSRGRMTAKESQSLAEPISTFDSALAQLCALVPVDVMPGPSDPSTYLLPQQPLHKCLLPLSCSFNSLHLTTNPYDAMIGGRLFVGTSGQPLENMFRFSRCEEAEPMSSSTSLEILEQTLLWQHMAPTAPDTLGCHPFKVMDPLILAHCPDVYFAGNQPGFATKVVEGPEGQKSRIICVPVFDEMHEAVLVDIDSLECTPYKLDTARVSGGSPSAMAE